MAHTDSARCISRGIVREYVVELERLGLLPAVLAKTSAATRAVIALGNAAPRWIDGARVDDLLSAVAAAAGRDVVRALGRLAMQRSVGTALQPIIAFVLSFRGRDPSALFARAASMAGIVSQGTRLSWNSTGDREGVMTLESDDPTPDASLAAWEGALSYAFDLTGADGSIAPPTASEDGRTCAIAISWRTAANATAPWSLPRSMP